jgi:hypothetical protein
MCNVPGDVCRDTLCVPAEARDGSSSPDLNTGPDGGGAPSAPGGPSKCPGTILFCDGMERDTFAGSAWHPFSTPAEVLGDTLVLDKTRAARGDTSLKVHIGADQEVSAGMFWRAGMQDEYFVRFFLFMPNSPPGNGYVSIEGEDALSANWTESVVSLSGVHPVVPPNLDLLTMPPAPIPIPRDQWVCVILHVQPQAFSLYIENETVPALTSALTQPAQLRDVYFRFYADRRGSGTPFDLWLDEIAIDKVPIHCAQ